MGYLTRKEQVDILNGIKDFFNDIGITTELADAHDNDIVPMLLSFMDTSDESVWSGEDMPDDPHAASVMIIQFKNDDEDGEDVFTKYLLLYFEVMVSLEGIDELTILRLINDINSSIPCGHFFYGMEEGDTEPAVHFKAMIGADTDEEFDEGVLGEAIVNMGILYDEMKEKLIDLKNSVSQ